MKGLATNGEKGNEEPHGQCSNKMNNDGNNDDGNRMTWIGKWNDVNGKKTTCMVTRQWRHDENDDGIPKMKH